MQKAHDSTKNNYWENYPSIETPIIAEQLNRIETSVDVIDDRVVAFDLTKANATDLAQTVKNITYNTETGVWVYTWWNGSTLTVDQNIEKIPVSFSMSPAGVITMTTQDGTQFTCDIATLIKTYTFLNSQTIAATDTVDENGNHQITLNVIDGSITESKLQPNFLADCRSAKAGAETAQQNSEAWAVGTKNGVPVGIDDDQYENYAKFYAENSEDNAENSEAWAVGQKNGVDVPNTDPTYHNNSKYWANQARAIVGDKVDSFNTRVGAVIPEKGDYDISQITPVSGAQVGQVPVIRNVGTGQEVELGFVLEAPSSSGHTILNNGGSEMYQRDYLQFKGLSVSDDSTEERTVVEHNINNDAPTFTEASTRANISSGESISTLFGKIKKFFTDIKDLAFISKDGSSSKKYLRGDGTWQAFSKSTVGLGNVDNTADNNKPVPIVECSTARSTANKAVALTGFTLKTGSRVYVRFTDTGTSNPASGNLTLNVNSTGAKTIVDGKTNKSVLTYSSAGWFYNNIVSEFVYDGTYWVWMSRDNNTTYSAMSASELTKGTATSLRTMRADYAKDGINQLIQTKAAADLTIQKATGTTNNSGSTILVGRFFYLNGTMCRALTDIAVGATFTVNTNYIIASKGALNECFRMIGFDNIAIQYAGDNWQMSHAYSIDREENYKALLTLRNYGIVYQASANGGATWSKLWELYCRDITTIGDTERQFVENVCANLAAILVGTGAQFLGSFTWQGHNYFTCHAYNNGVVIVGALVCGYVPNTQLNFSYVISSKYTFVAKIDGQQL